MPQEKNLKLHKNTAFRNTIPVCYYVVEILMFSEYEIEMN